MHIEGIPQSNNERDETGWSDTLPASESVGAPTNLSRRGFLKKAGAFLAGAATTSVVGVVAKMDGENILGETIEKEESERRLMEIRGRLRSQYGIEVDFSPMSAHEKSWDIDGKPVPYTIEKIRACEAIERTFMQYPPMMYKKRAIISRIRVVDELTNGGNERVDGTGILEVGDIFLEYEDSRDKFLEVDMRKLTMTRQKYDVEKKLDMQMSVHHEFEHLLDSVDEEKWLTEARMLSASTEKNSAYAHLLYDDELDALERNSRISSDNVRKYKSDHTGFARLYGRKDSLEDRATIIECLYTFPDYIADRLPDDSALAQKVAFMKKEYFNMSRGVMDKKYWDVVAQNPENPKGVAEYVHAHSQELFAMSDEELRDFAGTEDIELSDEDIKTWRDEIALGVERIDRQPL